MKQKQVVHRGPRQPFDTLIARLTGLDLEQARLIIRMGGAYLGKHRCKEAARQVENGATVAAYWQLPLKMDPVAFDPSWIVARDKGILVAAKPAGLPTQGRRDADYLAFYQILCEHLDGYLGLHHRLDQDTSGLMLFTRAREYNKDLAQAFSQRRIDKEYLAVCRGTWPFAGESHTIDDPIGSRRGSRGTKHMVMQGGKSARTRIRRLGEAEGIVLVAAKPETGRTHQIRVHLSHHQLPLAGDSWYGAEALSGDGPRFLLHCRRLAWPRVGMLAANEFILAPPDAWRRRIPSALGDLIC